nr:NAD(+) synthase [Synergistales bacterium]
MKVTLAQVNPTVGDISGNLQILSDIVDTVAPGETDLLVFPELFLTGYPPMDLLEKSWFIKRTSEVIREILQLSRSREDFAILMGCPVSTGVLTGKGLFNSALLVEKGEILFRSDKSLLPTYDVFDEARYFSPSLSVDPVFFRGRKIGITICEDAWNSPELWPAGGGYSRDPVRELSAKGAEMIINISASPFSVGKTAVRKKLLSGHAGRNGVSLVYLNQVGGNDELVFDGYSMVFDGMGRVCHCMSGFEESLLTVDMDHLEPDPHCRLPDDIGSVHDALVLGIRDYMRKCGFSRAIVGLSGGIDSAVTAVLAVRALGRENVLGVSMPSPYSSEGSVLDSRELATRLGMQFRVIPVSGIFGSFLDTLGTYLEKRGRAVAEENIQARIRGNMLM